MASDKQQVKQQLREALGTEAPLPPHSVEAEEGVLGSLLRAPDLMPRILGLVKSDDFYIVRNGWVFEAMTALYVRDDGFDTVTMEAELAAQSRLDEIGGAVYLAYLLNSTATDYYAEVYAQLVQRAADRRKLMLLADELMSAAHQEDVTVMTIFADHLARLMDAKPRALDKSLTPGSSIADRFLALQSREDGEVKVFPLPFGNENEGQPFFTAGKLFGIGGDEKTGKSALAETLSEHWALLGKRGFYIHTEEKPDDKILRRYARYSCIPFLKLETGNLSEKEIRQRGDAIQYTTNWQDRLDLWHESLPTPESVLALMLRAIQVFHVDFIVLDNFTDVDFTSGDPRASASQKAMKFLQQIDDLAARHNALIIVTTQMSTQETGKRIAFGTSAFAKKCSWFWDINRKTLTEPLEYEADGETHRLHPGAFDPRVEIFVPASRYSSGAKIKVFADLRRFYWRDRGEVTLAQDTPTINLRAGQSFASAAEPTDPLPLLLGGAG